MFSLCKSSQIAKGFTFSLLKIILHRSEQVVVRIVKGTVLFNPSVLVLSGIDHVRLNNKPKKAVPIISTRITTPIE